MRDTGRVPDCELCQAARFTEWFYEDEECWVAECESCDVPMIVWKSHEARPSDDVVQRLHERLIAVVGEFFVDDVYVDDDMRTIPDHYHAHARARGKWGRQRLERR